MLMLCLTPPPSLDGGGGLQMVSLGLIYACKMLTSASFSSFAIHSNELLPIEIKSTALGIVFFATK